MRFKRAVKKTRKFNAAQKEGLLKILDGISQAFIIGATIGASGFFENQVNLLNAAIILGLAIIFMFIAFSIRGSKE